MLIHSYMATDVSTNLLFRLTPLTAPMDNNGAKRTCTRWMLVLRPCNHSCQVSWRDVMDAGCGQWKAGNAPLYPPRQNNNALQWFHIFNSAKWIARNVSRSCCRRRCYTYNISSSSPPDVLQSKPRLLCI